MKIIAVRAVKFTRRKKPEMNGGQKIIEIMEKNKIIDVGDEEFVFNKLFLEILKSNMLKCESALDAIVFSIKSYLPESQTSEIALSCTFVMTVMESHYPDITKNVLNALTSRVNSHTLDILFDKSSFLPQSMDEIIKEIKNYEDWK